MIMEIQLSEYETVKAILIKHGVLHKEIEDLDDPKLMEDLYNHFQEWEKSANIIPIIEDKLFSTHNNRRQTFITWDKFTLRYLRELFSKQAFKDTYYE